MSDFLEQLYGIVQTGKVMTGEPMDRHTTFRVGGPADYYVEPETEEELAGVLALCRAKGLPHMLLGNGSNLLVGDRGYRGVIVALGRRWSQVNTEGSVIRAGGAAMLSAAAKQALRDSLAGLEFASGIPGTVGGAVFMNAGAYGSDMAQVLKAVTVMAEDGSVRTIHAEELELGYRTSCIGRKGYVVLEAELGLEPGEASAIRERMEELAGQRRAKQPLEFPSAGSTFKRPEGYFAGKLIQDAGLRGFAVGGAQVSEKHCGFVINRGGATAADIMELCRQVRQRVQEESGVELELEVRTVGEF